MPRAVWSGTLAFGLVTIPVRLFPATEPKDVRFHLVDERGRRVRYRRFVEREGPGATIGADVGETIGVAPEVTPDPGSNVAAPRGTRGEGGPWVAEPAREVAFEELRRGYETDDGRMVVLEREEIDALRPSRSRSIDIEDFVDLADIDPVYFEKTYHVVPAPGAEKPYALLLRAMERAGRVAIGRFVLRTKPHLVAIRPAGGALALETLFFGDEVRNARDLARGVEGVEVSERELELAASLIDALRTEWDPAAYADTYRDELLRRIAEKETVEPPAETAVAAGSGARVEELLQALRDSVEAAKHARGDAQTPGRGAGTRKRPAGKRRSTKRPA